MARGPAGTRFRLFPEYASGYAEPETVILSPPAGSIRAGPSDAAMYVCNPVRKPAPYAPPETVPPYAGPQYPPARPNGAGHFDHIPVETEQFLAAHLYGTIRRTLDIWEGYLGRRVVWWHADFMPNLELIPAVPWPNAHSGPGFIEMGMKRNETGREQLYCLNFDVMAHETGHTILFSQLGLPAPDQVSSEYLAFHESFSDLVGLIAATHFPSVIRKLLEETGGNLYVLNLLSRMGKLSSREQVRIASNTVTMDDVRGLRLGPDGSWIDPLGRGRTQHDLAAPLTGAIFDMLVEIYQDGLVARGVIHPALDPRGWTREAVEDSLALLDHMSSRALARFRGAFHAAIEDARDVVGSCMAWTMLTLRPETVSFAAVAARMLEAAAASRTGERLLPALLDHFLWRGIDPRPLLRLAVPPSRSRRPLRCARPAGLVGRRCGCRDPRAFWHVRRLMPHRHREAGTAVAGL